MHLPPWRQARGPHFLAGWWLGVKLGSQRLHWGPSHTASSMDPLAVGQLTSLRPARENVTKGMLKCNLLWHNLHVGVTAITSATFSWLECRVQPRKDTEGSLQSA